MKDLSNIEKSNFRKGEYVGYAIGCWYITKANTSYGNWAARKQSNTNEQLFAHNLEEMSRKLSAYEKQFCLSC